MPVKYDFALRLIVSGGQTGADQAGLRAGRAFSVETGGFAPDNFMTVLGPNPTLGSVFGLIEGGSYPTRTEKNVKLADATIRFASNFKSPGELCTLRAINKHHKPYLDIGLPADVKVAADAVVHFIEEHAVQVLNIAGNADRQHTPGLHYASTFGILIAALHVLDSRGLLAKKE